MNWELLLNAGAVLSALVLAFLYAGASVKASQVDQVRKVNEVLLTTSKSQRSVLVDKEDYIRELEKTVLGSLPASELATRLTRLFAANRSRAASQLPPAKPPTRTP